GGGHACRTSVARSTTEAGAASHEVHRRLICSRRDIWLRLASRSRQPALAPAPICVVAGPYSWRSLQRPTIGLPRVVLPFLLPGAAGAADPPAADDAMGSTGLAYGEEGARGGR